MFLFLLAACATPYPDACLSYQKLYCDTCELDDYEKALCTCIKTRKLTSDDAPSSQKMTDDDAQILCDSWLSRVDYPSPSQSSYCQQELVMMREYKADRCPQQDTFDSGI